MNINLDLLGGDGDDGDDGGDGIQSFILELLTDVLDLMES